MSTTSRNRHAPIAMLLWALLLLCGQTLALAHQHVDEAPGTSCAVCTLAKAETAACDAATCPMPAPAAHWQACSGDPAFCVSTPCHDFQPRGPPPV